MYPQILLLMAALAMLALYALTKIIYGDNLHD